MLGSELVDYLSQKKEIVNVYLNKICKNKNHTLLTTMMQSDFVFFLAANTAGDGTDFMKEKEKSYDFISNNLDLMSEVFECLKISKKPFIFASNHIVNDINSIHANIKKIGERYTESLGGISVRFWNLYGLQRNEKKYNAISNFIKQGFEKNTIDCQTDGQEKRQFLYTIDCCDALYQISKYYEEIKKERKYVDVTSFEWYTIKKVLGIIANELNCFWGVSNKKAKERMEYEPDSYFLTNYWKPVYTLEEGIKDLIERYKCHQ